MLPSHLPQRRRKAMTHLFLFDINDLRYVRKKSLREARALPPGPERNQKRQVARSLKTLAVNKSHLGDPFKSPRTNGWLNGQLRPPT
jgi:hypothetical protein